MIITVAAGTSTPTSITVVATSTSVVPSRNDRIAAALSAADICPVRRPTLRSENTCFCSLRASAVAALASEASLSSTSAHTTYA